MFEVSPELSAFATRELRGRGVEVLTETTLEQAEADRVRLSNGEEVPTRTLVWTAGVRPAPVVSELGLPLTEAGRIRVDAHMRVDGRGDVWAIGDAAAVPDPSRKDGGPCPPTAQHATRQGRTVARNVAAATGTGTSRPFSYRTRGVFVDMGRRQAVAETFGVKWSGLPAYLLGRLYYLSEIPGLARKLRLLADWTVGAVFGRDPSELGQIGRSGTLGAEAGAVPVKAGAPTPEGLESNGGLPAAVAEESTAAVQPQLKP